MYECNLKPNRIGLITVKNYKKFQLVLNDETQKYEVISKKDNFPWGEGKSPEGAIIGACITGNIPLKEIDISLTFVKLQEVVKTLKELTA